MPLFVPELMTFFIPPEIIELRDPLEMVLSLPPLMTELSAFASLLIPPEIVELAPFASLFIPPDTVALLPIDLLLMPPDIVDP